MIEPQINLALNKGPNGMPKYFIGKMRPYNPGYEPTHSFSAHYPQEPILIQPKLNISYANI